MNIKQIRSLAKKSRKAALKITPDRKYIHRIKAKGLYTFDGKDILMKDILIVPFEFCKDFVIMYIIAADILWLQSSGFSLNKRHLNINYKRNYMREVNKNDLPLYIGLDHVDPLIEELVDE